MLTGPNQKDRLDSLLESTIERVNARRWQILKGLWTGKKAAKAILAARSDDNSFDPEPSFGEGGVVADGTTTFYNTGVNGGSTFAPQWTPDPNTPEFSGDFNLSLGAYWGGVTPFFLESGDQFRIPAPPAIGSQEYIDAYKEVAGLGGSPENENTFSFSTPETRFVGNFWGYDATPLLGTPPRLYNQIARQVIKQNFDELEDQSINEAARLLAVLNASIADAGIAAWDSKWYYNYWRPVTGIRTEDGVSETIVDPTWDPVGVSIINVELPEDQAFIRPSPPFPAYPSGHATFGAATFEVLRRTFGNDTPFSFVSDEYNGEGVDPFDPSVTRPLVPVFFATLDEAQESNGRSRIYNGVHWSYDNIQGQALGENLVDYLFSDNISAFKPVR